MNDKIVDLMSITTDNYDSFMRHANVDTSFSLTAGDYDYSWLSQVEQYLPFISNIVNFDYSEADQDVETSYENRFIKTLLYRLNDFIILEENRLKNDSMTFSSNYTSTVKSEMDDASVSVDVKVSIDYKKDDKGSSYGLTLKERIARVSTIVTSLLKSHFIETLKDSSFIRNPVSKTPILEEETNYRKALELYNFIENFKTASKSLDSEDAKTSLDNRNLTLSYLAYQNLETLKSRKDTMNAYQTFLNHLIEKMVVTSSMDEKSFKRMITKKFEDEYNKKKTREQNIQNIFLKNIDSYNKQVKDALRALKN